MCPVNSIFAPAFVIPNLGKNNHMKVMVLWTKGEWSYDFVHKGRGDLREGV
jgi:hypothetical protein